MAEAQESRFMEALKIIGAMTGLIGGVAGVFAVVGYVIILAFANETGIYGRTNFTQQLPFESLFSALFDWFRFCGKNWGHLLLMLFFSSLFTTMGLWAGSPDLEKPRKDWSLKALTIAGGIVGVLMIIAIGQYDIRQAGLERNVFLLTNIFDNAEILLYAITVPLLAGLIIVLITRYRTAFPKKGTNSLPLTKRTWYCATASVFTAVLLLVPFMYGTVFYDLPLNKMRAPVFADSVLNSRVGAMFPNDFTSSYFGHVADQCLFLTDDQSQNGWRIMIVPKDQLRSIELLRGKGQSTGLRDYYRNVAVKSQEAALAKRDTLSESDASITDFLNK